MRPDYLALHNEPGAFRPSIHADTASTLAALSSTTACVTGLRYSRAIASGEIQGADRPAVRHGAQNFDHVRGVFSQPAFPSWCLPACDSLPAALPGLDAIVMRQPDAPVAASQIRLNIVSRPCRGKRSQLDFVESKHDCLDVPLRNRLLVGPGATFPHGNLSSVQTLARSTMPMPKSFATPLTHGNRHQSSSVKRISSITLQALSRKFAATPGSWCLR